MAYRRAERRSGLDRIDPEIDFAALSAKFDTGLMGRRTYEAAIRRLGEKAFRGPTWSSREL